MVETKQNERLKKVAEVVHKRLFETANIYPGERKDPQYRWEHTVRVTHYGRLIAEAEGAHVEQVMAA